MRPVRLDLAVLSLVFAGSVLAQAYPNKPVKIIVAFTAGSATDILARVVAEQFTRSMGQPFVVENKPGAGGSVGAEQAKNAPADGYTLVAAGSGPFGINPAIYKSLPYDPVKDFAPITMTTAYPYILVVNSELPDSRKSPGEKRISPIATWPRSFTPAARPGIPKESCCRTATC